MKKIQSQLDAPSGRMTSTDDDRAMRISSRWVASIAGRPATYASSVVKWDASLEKLWTVKFQEIKFWKPTDDGWTMDTESDIDVIVADDGTTIKTIYEGKLKMTVEEIQYLADVCTTFARHVVDGYFRNDKQMNNGIDADSKKALTS